MKRFVSLLAATAAVLILAGCGSAGDAIPAAPPLERPIVDQTNTLSDSEIDDLSAITENGRKADGIQTGILVVDSVPGGQELEEYSIDVARDWGVGEEQTDNGVLIVVAVDDHELRIEVGRGLEGAIPDAVARRIGDNLMVPHMKDDDLYGALVAGASAIHADDVSAAADGPADDGGGIPLWLVIVIVIAIILVLVVIGIAVSSGGGYGGGGGSSGYSSYSSGSYSSSSSSSSSSSFGGGGFSGGGSSSSW